MLCLTGGVSSCELGASSGPLSAPTPPCRGAWARPGRASTALLSPVSLGLRVWASLVLLSWGDGRPPLIMVLEGVLSECPHTAPQCPQPLLRGGAGVDREVRPRPTPGGPWTPDGAVAELRDPQGPPPLRGLDPGLWLPECSPESVMASLFLEVFLGLWPRAWGGHIRVLSTALIPGGDSLQKCVLLPLWPGLVGSGELRRACSPPLACRPLAAPLPQLPSRGSLPGPRRHRETGRAPRTGQRQPSHTPPFLQSRVGRAPGDSRGRRQRGTHHRGPGWGEECTGPGEGTCRPL